MSQEHRPVKRSSTPARKIRPSRYVNSTPVAGSGECGESRLPQPTQLDLFSNRLEADSLRCWSRLHTGRTGSGRASTSVTTVAGSAIELQKRALLSAISGSSS